MPRINIAPSAALISSIRQRNFTLINCAAEIFDNSFDAGADLIEVTISDGSMKVIDNGRGIQDIEALFRIGKHSGIGQTIGRYGVGFKDAAIWMADAVEVDSWNGRQHIRSHVNWPAIEDTGNWDIDYQAVPSRRKGDSYTTLIFHGLNTRRVKLLESHIMRLAYEFAPGLRTGAIIRIGGANLQPPSHPALENEIHIDDLFEGRHFRLLAGIKADRTEPRRCGYDVAYRHRLIVQHDTRRAFGDYSAANFYGYLELLDDGERWTLGTHKTDFEERDELYEFIYERIEPLLIKAEEKAQDIEFSENLLHVQAAVSKAASQAIREMRSAGKEDNTPGEYEEHDPPEYKRRRATRSDPGKAGSVERDRSGGRIRIMLDEDDPKRIGWVEEARSYCIVHLNPGYEHVDFTNFNELMILAITLYASHFAVTSDNKGIRGQSRFNWEDEEAGEKFVDQLSRLLRAVSVKSRESTDMHGVVGQIG